MFTGADDKPEGVKAQIKAIKDAHRAASGIVGFMYSDDAVCIYCSDWPLFTFYGQPDREITNRSDPGGGSSAARCCDRCGRPLFE